MPATLTLRVPQELVLRSSRGPIEAHFYRAPRAKRAVVWVGGIVGGFDSPARSLYPELAATLAGNGIASLRIRMRRPAWIPGSVEDVRTGIRYLRRKGIDQFALIGHSIGSAVVLQAAGLEGRRVRAVIALASFGFRANAVTRLPPGCASLFIHGGRDALLPAMMSARLHEHAPAPKRFRRLPNAGHRLGESRRAVRREILGWLALHLNRPAAS